MRGGTRCLSSGATTSTTIPPAFSSGACAATGAGRGTGAGASGIAAAGLAAAALGGGALGPPLVGLQDQDLELPQLLVALGVAPCSDWQQQQTSQALACC